MTEKSNADKHNDTSPYFTGRLLLAMPNMGDPRFHKAVILICSHDEHGAMGLVLNHMLPGLNMQQLLSQLNLEEEITLEVDSNEAPVLSGGPVETARGFILHSNDFFQEDTIQVNDNISVTGTVDALKEIANGKGPDKMLFILGYAGWSPGQLDDEIQQNAWLIAEPDIDLVFSTRSEQKWDKAIKNLGVDPAMLSGVAGTA
jgi:putative transcriptional regulator